MNFLRLSVLLSLAAPVPVLAQNQPAQQQASTQRLTLQQCIELAVQNNLQIRQTQLQSQQARLNYNSSRGNLLPSINGSVSHSYNFGRSIDPATNQFVDDRIQSNNFSVSGNLVLFRGFQNQNSIKQNKLEHEAAQLDTETARNNIMLQVVTAYLQILFADELVETSRLQLQNTQAQLDRAQKLFNAGSIAETNVVELRAQAATDELNIITAQNQRDLAKLSLIQLLNLKNVSDIEIVKPNIPEPGQAPLPASPEQVYETALGNQPQIKSSEIRIRSAIKGVQVARGGYSPTLSAFGQVFTLYSTARERVSIVAGPSVTQSFVFEGPDGQQFPVTTQVPTTSAVFSPYPFNDQFRDNISKSFGLSLNIPILNGFQVRNNINRARIAHENAQLQSDIEKQQLFQNIQQAFTDARAAQQRYAAATRQLASFEQAFTFAQKRFDQGVINSTDYNVSKNNFTRAQSDLIQAKYDYIFKRKVLEFYQGKPLTL